MTLPGKSTTIVVEPLRSPATVPPPQPAVPPAPPPGPAAPQPART